MENNGCWVSFHLFQWYLGSRPESEPPTPDPSLNTGFKVHMTPSHWIRSLAHFNPVLSMLIWQLLSTVFFVSSSVREPFRWKCWGLNLDLLLWKPVPLLNYGPSPNGSKTGDLWHQRHIPCLFHWGIWNFPLICFSPYLVLKEPEGKLN